jgi:hypothetical protein
MLRIAATLSHKGRGEEAACVRDTFLKLDSPPLSLCGYSSTKVTVSARPAREVR